MSEITKELIKSSDEKYRAFQSSLVPNVSNVLGVRAPICKSIAKRYAKAKEGASFMDTLPHQYYDEYIVHGYMLGFLESEDILPRLKELLPYMDNWAVVDSSVSNLKSFFKDKGKAHDFILSLLLSNEEFVLRFAIVSLLVYYLDSEWASGSIDLVKQIKSDKFYVKMAQAWFFATALTKQYELAIGTIEGKELEPWVHNKSIQKAKESLCVPKSTKEYLNTLKIK